MSPDISAWHRCCGVIESHLCPLTIQPFKIFGGSWRIGALPVVALLVRTGVTVKSVIRADLVEHSQRKYRK